ncbi:MAG: Rrf2 family transcriptional regulator [Proteobacteria bacterium]|nr:Rrf2 family transcriptional regulator [Pseudomonadota bacterium]
MQLSSKTRYSIMAVAELAVLETQEATKVPVSLALISERQKISLSYLEQLFSKLKKAGLIKSIKGPGGGYNLAKNANDIKLSEIRFAIDAEAQDTQTICPEGGKCTKEFKCNSYKLWGKLSERINEFLDDITLQNLLDNEF